MATPEPELSTPIPLALSCSLSLASLDSTLLNTPRSFWYTKKLRFFTTCSSRYASGNRSPRRAMRRHRAGTELSVYPSGEYINTLSGRVRFGGWGEGSDGEVEERDRRPWYDCKGNEGMSDDTDDHLRE
jgi:hypothetical protein